ncbi:uncharacterized protein LOC113560736 [Rhopalosiphum maidis]|uniref:uncharacterized protein LOC113560736 n=1 Tax=Rhopalosiphum maidis TaxID=43146 RepID=UPI000EFE037F|nr:uncharacterized protein LOC113560736 [Rhopalosiphum maidis]
MTIKFMNRILHNHTHDCKLTVRRSLYKHVLKNNIKTDILKFFKKPRLENDEIENSFNNQSQPTEPAENASPETNVFVSLPEFVHQHDIGLYVNKPATESIDLIPGLQNLIWTPPEDYKFPISEKRNFKFQRSWLLKYKWLAYSAIMNGVFCKYCVLFSIGGGGIGHQTLGLLVKKPFTNWKKALESFSYHNSLEYHKTSLLKSNIRAEIDNQNILPVDLQISEQQLDFINESKNV